MGLQVAMSEHLEGPLLECPTPPSSIKCSLADYCSLLQGYHMSEGEESALVSHEKVKAYDSGVLSR